MATRSEQQRATVARTNSAQKRAAVPAEKPTRSQLLKAATANSKHGRALHAPTKLQADAKAGKPDPGRITGFFKTGANGGEPQTFNGVPGTGRGSDGPADVHKASRKSTRGGVPAGEKPSSQTRNVIRATHTPEKRAARSAARSGAPAKSGR